MSTCTPSLPSTGRIGSRSSGTVSSIVISLPVTAARPMKLATSMCSGQIRNDPPPSRSVPSMRSRFDPIPSISAPSATRNRQRSWTCGSQAAFPISVEPVASEAAMIAFSVPVTLASSRNIEVPRSAGPDSS